MSELIFEDVGRILYKTSDAEILYFDRQIVEGEVYANIHITEYDRTFGSGVVTMRPRFYIRKQESWMPLKGSGHHDLDRPIIRRLNELEPAV